MTRHYYPPERRPRVPVPRWTPAREAWLQKLKAGPALRANGVVGADCQELGWAEWIDWSNAAAGERLTEKGAAQLAAWLAGDRDPAPPGTRVLHEVEP
jgi:hypothetical protein